MPDRREIVYAPGCWDLLHLGHLEFLRRAKALGDVLVVGVASDEVIEMDKGTKPYWPLYERIVHLELHSRADLVLPYFELEFLTHLRAIRPSWVAVGEGWGQEQRHRDAEDYMASISFGQRHRVRKIPYTKGISSTILKELTSD